MKPFLYKKIMLIAVFAMLGNTVSAADETSESTAETSPGVVVKVKNAIEPGAKAAAHGIERGANATVRGLKRGAKATANGLERGATATGNAARSVAKKLEGSSDESPSSDKPVP